MRACVFFTRPVFWIQKWGAGENEKRNFVFIFTKSGAWRAGAAKLGRQYGD